MAQEPHPQVQGVLDLLDTQPIPPTDGLAVESARERMREMFLGDDEPEPVGHVDDFAIPGPDLPIPVRLYLPDGDGPHPLVVYYHGGGFMLGDLDTADPVCRALANEARSGVLSVDYRLAPDHPFPAGLLDAYAALEWAAEYAGEVTADPDRLAVAGSSAGGNLAAAVSLLARDRDGPAIAHQSLIYPALRAPVQEPYPSYEENAEGYLLERDAMEHFNENYLRYPTDARNEYAWPLLVDDLSGLPPATIVTAGFDPLRDEGAAYADRLRDAGVPVTHENYADMIHGFTGLLDAVDRARESIEFVATELRGSIET